MNFDMSEMALAALRVLGVGLLLGAGLPALFAVGLRLQSAGAGEVDGEGAGRRPLLTALAILIFAIVIVVVLAAVLYITRTTIYHHFGISLFGAK